MIYVTGDCHGEFSKFSTRNFPSQKKLKKDDFVIVCGDFGIWHQCKEEDYWLKWLDERSFTTLFVDGNHENFDRLYSEEFPIVDFHGGKAQMIRENIFHLMRGYVYELSGKTFFTFGGAHSHDIQDGILRTEDYPSHLDLRKDFNIRKRMGELIRVEHESWWKEELPSEEEMNFGLGQLQRYNNKVDYVITHCLPYELEKQVVPTNPNSLTLYLSRIFEQVSFKKWYCGHYHTEKQVTEKCEILYRNFIRLE